jgi:hypothetical protein
MVDMNVTDYLSLVRQAYSDTGGIEGQRAPLKTKTARTIRARMVSDISRGTVLPPIVLGLLISPDQYSSHIPALNDAAAFFSFVETLPASAVMIIDGMQRTTAIEEAFSIPASTISNIRVEFWISSTITDLIYRMLVLNTGQVPWEVARQLETIYQPLLSKIQERLSQEITVAGVNRPPRTVLDSHSYPSDELIELLLIFSSRKREINLKDQLAQDFARIDMIESSAHGEFLEYFCQAITLLNRLNAAFSTYQPAPHDTLLTRFKNGSDLFASFTAKIGFISALSVFLFNRPGFEIDWQSVEPKWAKIKTGINRLVNSLESTTNGSEKAEILQFDELEERLLKHRVASTQVGRFEREYFEKAFSILFENIEKIHTLTPCWMAY